MSNSKFLIITVLNAQCNTMLFHVGLDHWSETWDKQIKKQVTELLYYQKNFMHYEQEYKSNKTKIY